MLTLGEMRIAHWTTNLRPIDPVTVGRYRQAWRSGADFPAVILDKSDYTVISGNHRVTAALMEYGPEATIPYELRPFKSHAERLQLLAEENSRHGAPMDGITRKRIAHALLQEGVSTLDTARTLQVPVSSIERWCGETVLVIGKGQVPVKRGVDTTRVSVMGRADYATHIKSDLGVYPKQLLDQLIRWLQNGLIDPDKYADRLSVLKDLL